ncbi:MAG: hypothetical protein AB9866_24775 [Syntrophobacteraceae bacterium]
MRDAYLATYLNAHLGFFRTVAWVSKNITGDRSFLYFYVQNSDFRL